MYVRIVPNKEVHRGLNHEAPGKDAVLAQEIFSPKRDASVCRRTPHGLYKNRVKTHRQLNSVLCSKPFTLESGQHRKRN